MQTPIIKIHFSDFFDVDPALLEEYGAFNISLINDLPLFIDPFLVFNSTVPAHQKLHNDIIHYLKFLRDKSMKNEINAGLLKAWFRFGEVRQNWLGYSKVGNGGRGLGHNFAVSLSTNLNSIFSNFGEERVTKSSHLEKLCLISEGVGRDNISDFATNLIKEYLLDYTQVFAKKHLSQDYIKKFSVEKIRFNYRTETWESGTYELPAYNGSFVILTPKNILSKDEIWINRNGLFEEFNDIAASVPDDQLRSQINNYFHSLLSVNPKKGEREKAVNRTVLEFPQLIEYYIKRKEEQGEQAKSISEQNVEETETLFIKQVDDFVRLLAKNTSFYDSIGDTYNEALDRVMFLKNVIENNDGHRLFYLDGKPIKREEDLQILYRLTWRASPSDVNREVNNGRGPVDFKVSRGSPDKTLVELKLASNSQLKRNLENQVEIYQAANQTDKAIKVILYFSLAEHEKVNKILKELQIEGSKNIILIDARDDNKPSATKA